MPAEIQELTGFGLYARRKRKERGWNQLDLSLEMGTDQGTVSRLERGQMPNALTIVRWTSALGLDPREVFAVLAGSESVVASNGEAPPSSEMLDRALDWWQSRPDLQADYEWAERNLPPDKFEQFIANTFGAWESNWKMALKQVRLGFE